MIVALTAVGFASHVAVFIWMAGVALTIPALMVAGAACRNRAQRPAPALKWFRVAAMLAFLDAAALCTVLLSILIERGTSEAAGERVDIGVWMFQFAITSILWGVLLLIRKKLVAPAGSGGS